MEGLIMKYFVLKPKGNDIYAKASREAMKAYAFMIKNENEQFAKELLDWVMYENEEAD
jgi:hypothetical protein